MLTETALEALHFLGRRDLEGLQMHSRFLRDSVDRNSATLPLRRIYRLITNEHGNVEISKIYEDGSTWTCSEAELTQTCLGHLFNRVNNAFVEFMQRRFEDLEVGDEVGARVLRHLRENAAELQCRIKTVFVTTFVKIAPANVDFTLVDFLACHLKVQVLSVDIWDAQQTPQTTLFDHASMRSTLKHVNLIHFDDASLSAANRVIPALLDVDTLQTCSIQAFKDVTSWIIRFANASSNPTFEAASRGKKVIRSVSVVRNRSDEPGVFAPTSEAFSALGKPQREAVPAEPRVVVHAHVCDSDHIQSTAELFIVTNRELRKRLEVYKWAADKPGMCGRYDVFLLQIIDI